MFIYFRQLKQNYHTLSNRNLPASIAVARLMTLSQHLMAYETLIVLADNQIYREALTKDFLDHLRQSRQLLNTLSSTSHADKDVQDIVQHFTIMADNLNRLVEFSNHDTRVAVLPDKTEIENYGNKLQDSFSPSLKQMGGQHLIQENLAQNQFVSSELGKRVDILLTDISKEVDASRHQFDRRVQILSIMTFIPPLIVSILGLALIIYVHRSVVKRISALEKSVSNNCRGGPLKICTDGNDEISSMAKSVLSFIHKRNQYQASLKKNLALTARATQKLARGDLSARIEIVDNDPTRHLSARFNQMADRIESLITGQRHMFQAVSHELRIPLSRIAFNLEMISEDHHLKRKKHLVSEISNDIDEIDNLIKEMLLYARFSSHTIKLVVEPIRLPDALTRMITPQKTTNRRIIKIEIHNSANENIEVTAQPFYFKLAIQNLLSNAVHYASHKVWIRYDQTTTGVRIEVCDDGPGIPMEARHMVFEPFARLDGSRDRKTGGAGLGLAIVRRIVEHHGGSVSILDNDGHGTRVVTFWPSR
jgi:signal transduction histidine kinase